MIKHGKTPTGINFLGGALAEIYEVKTYSDKKNQWLRLFHMIFGLIKHARSSSFVLIDTYSTLGFYFAFIISQLSRILRVPYIPILRGGNLPVRFKQSPKLSHVFLKNAHKLVIPSTFLQDKVESMGYKPIFIPNLIDLSQYRYKQREALKPRLVWIRSFKDIYNPTMAVRTLAGVKKTHPDAELCMIGPSIDYGMEACQNLAKELAILDSIKFTGMLSKQSLREVAAEYDIFINTTNVDNTPMTVLEAMAMGIPVVSTNAGGIPYLVADGKEALLVQINDHQAMIERIHQLLQDKALVASLTKNALQKAQIFDKQQVLEKWKTILN